MITFEDDDNDDSLSLDANKRPAFPPAQKKATPSPFNRPTPAVPSEGKKLPSAPQRAATPFNAPKRPGAEPSNVAKPDTGSTQRPSFPPRPPARAPFPPAQEPYVPEAEPAPEVSNEADSYLLGLANGSGQTNNQRSQPAPQQDYQVPSQQTGPSKEQLYRLVPEGVAPTAPVTPTTYATTPAPAPEPIPKKRSWKDKPEKKAKPARAVKAKPEKKKSKPARENTYAGDRKKLLLIRGVAVVLAGVFLIAGFKAMFIPDSGPTPAQVQAVAKKAVNFTDFPTQSGEQFAMDFARAYFTFSSNDADRRATLSNFVSPDLLQDIEIRTLSPAEYDAENGDDAPAYSQYVVSQSIVYGPYVVASKNITEKSAVFTVKLALESGSVIYMDVPVKYEPKNYSLTLAGPPSFVKPIQNVGKSKESEYMLDLGSGDKEIQDDFRPDLETYLSAWASSDSTIINRYLLEGATDNAKNGLQGSVQLKSLDKFLVEPLDEARPQTANARKAEVTVTWEDPKTGLRYPQQYRILLGLNQEKDWSIYDIENFANLNE
jgi:hypothetical protein